MSFAKKITSERTASLELIKGYRHDDKPFFAYIVIKNSDLDKLKQKKEDDLIDLSKDSIILYSDFGHEVPEGIEEKVMEDFKKLLKNSE